ncbi:MAG: YggT family protein [Actinobacteria bacterium]|jgi:YggT family protein|nr:YggT family protein [Actinomycetota bacterium]MBT4009375.1 YggT family protein [Actinomycetota bacterium]MBT4302367.1 YggT family protein [Actinomycetota bacterium]MBT4477031.1 YggT family protein [Actinomycetota bacterium]MBT5504944.1 YggT family protein [Actinomycetota bacterium]
MNEIICSLLGLYLLLVLLRVVLSWIPLNPQGTAATVAGFVYYLTDPVLLPLRRIMPPLRMGGMGLDLAPLVIFFAISILRQAICA